MNPKPYIIGAALLAAVSFSQAQERVEQSKLPAAVQRALTSSSQADKSGAVKEITKRTVDGKVVYDVEFEKDNAINPRLRIAEDGTVMSRGALAAAGSDAAAATRSATASANREVTTASRDVKASADRQAASAKRDMAAAERDLSKSAERHTDAAKRDLAAAERDLNKSADRRMDSMRRDVRGVDSESMLQLSALPMAVRNTIEKETKGREIVDIDEETQDGKKVYEVEFAQAGLNSQIHVSEDGTIVKSEDKSGLKGLFAGTQLKDTPSAVQATIKREVGNLEIADIDKERRTGRVVYEVEVNDPAKGKWQIHVAEDGSVVKDDRAVAE